MKVKLSGEIASEYNGGVDVEYVAVDDIIEWMQNNGNPCMNCGSVQCAICSDVLLKELKVSDDD